MKLIFFGGVKGVGKTTLLAWLKEKYSERIVVLDAGELFRRYHYESNEKTVQEVEELIVRTLENMPKRSVVAIHWHYAVRHPSGYIPQISYPRLQRIAKSGFVEEVILLLVQAPINLVYERRLKDTQIKKRALSRLAVREEVDWEKKLLWEHYALFSQLLGKKKVSIFRLNNKDLRTAQKHVYALFEKLVT